MGFAITTTVLTARMLQRAEISIASTCILVNQLARVARKVGVTPITSVDVIVVRWSKPVRISDAAFSVSFSPFSGV
jgi:hypothetical protein